MTFINETVSDIMLGLAMFFFFIMILCGVAAIVVFFLSVGRAILVGC